MKPTNAKCHASDSNPARFSAYWVGYHGGSSFVCDDAIPFPAVLGSLAMLAAIRHASSRSVPIHNVFGLLRKDGVKGEFALIGRIGFNCYGHICDL